MKPRPAPNKMGSTYRSPATDERYVVYVGQGDIGTRLADHLRNNVSVTRRIGQAGRVGYYRYATCADEDTIVARGDSEGLPITGVDLGAAKIREHAAKHVQKSNRLTFLWNWIGKVRQHLVKKPAGKSSKKH